MPHSASDDYYDPDAWIRHAKSDLALARARPRDVLPEHRCWHAQQAAEKALKAVLVSRGAEVAHTHNFNTILRALKAEGVSVPASVGVVRDLGRHAAETRYPALGEASEFRPEEEIKKARAALIWAKKEIARAKAEKNRTGD